MSRFNVEDIIKESLLNEDLYEYYQIVNEGGTAGIPHDIRNAEMNVQYNVLKYLSDGDNDVVIKLIDLLGGYFRKVIKEFRKDGRIPSEEDLINYTNKYYGYDITKIAKELKA